MEFSGPYAMEFIVPLRVYNAHDLPGIFTQVLSVHLDDICF